MSISTSPRKTVPLAPADDSRSRTRSLTQSTTRRVFYCGVVVGGSEHGRRLPEEIQDLVLSLGQPVAFSTSEMFSSSSSSSVSNPDHIPGRKRTLTDTSALTSVITELVTSERTYVKRLQMLKNDYADPLRTFARSKETAIIPAYEAKTLFGNIDNLLPVNEAFLVDLEKMLVPSGSRTVGGVGDVALRHFKELRGFEQYKQYYVKREDAQLIFEREASKRSSRFAAYIDHIKYQANEKNRVGLRELLMEPVQRIPRYTLLFRTMLKHMAPDDPQRAKIIEADEIASKIALAEADEQTKRAAVFYCLTATIDGFPPDLFSNSRKFIDCVDVEDILSEPSMTPASSAAAANNMLHCTLFLFDDKLVIVKRPGGGEKGGKALTGLDELDKVTKAGGIPTGKKKSGMSCKGVMDVTDVVATDVGGADFHLYLENPPQDQTERWSGRPFRSLTVVNPSLPKGLDLVRAETDKQRFLGNLWHVQAMYRSRAGQSVVLCSDEQEVECRSGRTTIARTYFNVYQRTAFLQEQKKTKIVAHIDPLGSADPIPFGVGNPPFARIRVQPLAGGLCRYSVSSNDPDDEPEEDIIQTERVPSRVIQTIHQFGLFEFRTGKNSLPSTPTSRSRVARFGLDALSRNLFNSRPGSAMDFFSGSINGHRRAKSTISRSSMYTQTTNTTGDGSLAKFSSRSNSTAATTVFSMDEDASFFLSKSSKGNTKKLFNRARSPAASASESERDSSRPVSRAGSLTVPSVEKGPEYSDYEDEDGTIQEKINDIDSSDYNLAKQLELARQNSLNQHAKPGLTLDVPVEETIYEEDPPTSLRPSLEPPSHRSTTPRPESLASPEHLSRPVSRQSDRRPMGPRSVSPNPIPRSPESASELPCLSDDPSSESSPTASPEPALMSLTSLPLPSNHSTIPTPIPRSKRQPFQHCHHPTGNTEATPKAPSSSSATAVGIAFPTGPTAASLPSHVEPLSIKKKNSGRSSTVNASPLARRSNMRNSPLSRPGSNRVGSPRVSPRRVSPQFKKTKHVSNSSTSRIKSETLEHLSQLAVSTKEDIELTRKVVKKMKVEIDGYRPSGSRGSYHEDAYSRPSSPDKSSRAPPGTLSAPLTKEAQARMEEMRALIGKRQTADGVSGARTRTSIFDAPKTLPSSGSDEFSRRLDDLISDVDKNLVQALSHQEALQNELKTLNSEFREKAIELEHAKLDLQNSKRQCKLVRSLLDDATAEKEIMYEAFNEELDGMYNDASLPDDEAWRAMAKDLQETKEARNNFSRENSQMKRQIAELESQQEEWAALLRAHGLIS
ncbi:Rho guanine nucleotide exchange factor gef2 [Leucoagaricus sp. SymC.cos]|nr:Rho guanine nucleotide exchange factor gef2 [Leucoagaricus sp. SymC.cos]